MRQISIFLILLAAFTLLRYPYTFLPLQLASKLESIARQAKVPLAVDNPQIHFPLHILIERVQTSLQIARTQVPLEARNVDVSISPLRLALLTVVGEYKARVFGASVHGELSKGLFSDSFYLDTAIDGLEAAQVYEVLPYLSSGVFDILWMGHVHPSSQAADGKFSLSLRDGVYPGGDKVMGLIALPKVESIALTLAGAIQGKTLSISALSLNSSLGELDGTGTVTLSGQRIESVNAELLLSLSADATRQFGGFLALAAKPPAPATTRTWRLRIEQKVGQTLPVITTSASAQ